MAKRILIDSVYYRERRGKLVAIPPQWVGKVTSPETIRTRPSKLIHKHRKAARARTYRLRSTYEAIQDPGPTRASARREHES